jgi:uncharacterized protein (DUF342 family)
MEGPPQFEYSKLLVADIQVIKDRLSELTRMLQEAKKTEEITLIENSIKIYREYLEKRIKLIGCG